MTQPSTCTSCKRNNTTNINSCPLWMQDGRSLGDYRYTPRCEQQYDVVFDDKLYSSFEYRQYLIQNAERLMKENFQKSVKSFQ